MTVTVKHGKTNAIADWTQADLDAQIALGNFPAGTTLADIVLPSDWNDDHSVTGLATVAETGSYNDLTDKPTLGTIASQNANNVAITGGSINGTTIGATTASTGKFTSVTTPSVTASATDLTLSAISTGSVKLNTAGGTGFQVTDNGTSTTWWTAYGSTVSPVLEANGATANGIIRTSGTGSLYFRTNATLTQLLVAHTASAVNYVQVTGAATTKATVTSSQGSDSNISMAFQPKGTGAIDLAAGSSGVNISNGGTVTAITRTAAGSGYTSIPSVAITAPTTAGGVQATVSVNQMQIATAAIAGGGTGYTAGDTLTIVGGTPVTSAATLTVSTVSAGVITGVSIAAFNNYTVLPTNPVSVTGGTGTGATFNLTFAVINFTITNAGSGYIEQPTVSFSGGGGSGAAAYATVGGGTIFRSLATTSSFYTASGEQLRVEDTYGGGALSVNYIRIRGRASGAAPIIAGAGETNTGLNIASSGTGSIGFQTNNGGTQQFNITHTASAVNYVQVTGAATTGFPVISAQGSDTNTGLILQTKGSSYVRISTGGSPNNDQLRVNHTASAVNYFGMTGAAAGGSPTLSVAGTDTNIDLALTPKGTGLVRFGTYTAGALLATGYISIKAADGTTYKVLVST